MGVNVTDIIVNDKSGNPTNVILGNDHFDPAIKSDLSPPSGCMNTIVGPYANRISFGQFKTKDGSFQLECNLGEHHLHGAGASLDKAIWTVIKAEVVDDLPTLILALTAVDGDGGYPGNRISLLALLLIITINYVLPCLRLPTKTLILI